MKRIYETKLISHGKKCKGGQNFMCDKCQDEGYVYSWVFFQVTCPKCKGDPVSVMPPRPPDPKGQKNG